MKIHTELKIDSAHRLPNYEGPCHNLHGHSWNIVIEIETDELDKNDFVLDFRKIKETVMVMDHNYLNKFVKNPTAENLAFYIATKIKELGRMTEKTDGSYCELVEPYNRFNSVLVRVYEAEKSYAEITL